MNESDRDAQVGDVMVAPDGHVSILRKRDGDGWLIDRLMSPDGTPGRGRGAWVSHREEIANWKRIDSPEGWPREWKIGQRCWYKDAILTLVLVGAGSGWRRHDGKYGVRVPRDGYDGAKVSAAETIFVGMAPVPEWTPADDPSPELIAARKRIRDLEAQVINLGGSP